LKLKGVLMVPDETLTVWFVANPVGAADAVPAIPATAAADTRSATAVVPRRMVLVLYMEIVSFSL
jgi:hypothetical protein